jgi:hypothetical protein
MKKEIAEIIAYTPTSPATTASLTLWEVLSIAQYYLKQATGVVGSRGDFIQA